MDELAFFAPALPARLLPDWDVLPYDIFSPSAETAGRRIAALAAAGGDGITVAAAATALEKFPPPEFVAARTFDLQTGGKLDLHAMKERLLRCGYTNTGRVCAPGEFSLCGGQMDVFPPGCDSPFRLVMLDDEIEQIRIFDPRTQRSQKETSRVRLLPAGECDLSAEGRERFLSAWRERFGEEEPPPEMSAEKAPAGAECLLPLFFEKSAALFDYLTSRHLLFVADGARDAAADFLQRARERETSARARGRAVLPAEELFLNAREFFARAKAQGAIELRGALSATKPPPLLRRAGETPAQSAAAAARAVAAKGMRVVVATAGEGARAAMLREFAKEKETNRARAIDGFGELEKCGAGEITVAVAALRGGFLLPERKLAVICENETTAGARAVLRAQNSGDFSDAGEILPGDFVVHRQHGIGKCHGLKTATLGGIAGEFFEIEYADEKRLWLPVAQMHQLCRHHGGGALSSLGGGGWRRARRRAEKNARDTAARLLEIHARRLAAGGGGIRPDEKTLAQFASRFPWPETPDQSRAIEETLADMRAEKPMDRLIAADVGFGKTEIAMRAACACALSGAQTAILAPTTLLAEQHARNFADRFAGFPATVGALNRLTGAREKKQLLQSLAEGKTDIAVGTHALLQTSARYKNLGLVVIDEEHRFGVRQKEHFKSLRANVNVLSLSATPIPRTTAMATEGLRDLSLVSTPPAGRLPIQTMVRPFSRGVIAEACEREMQRGGQIYFVHNDIGGIEDAALQLREWIPRAQTAVAHGRMPAARIEEAMRRFLRGEAHILVCTTIIESGLDIANVNTVIVNRADAMGVSRLHQLRGRVGRALHQGYAYFLTPAFGAATKEGAERLAAVRDCAQLGGGFLLAMRDLEIRGAGEILGERQSGEIAGVGCALYQKMVREAARALRGKPAQSPVTVDLGEQARLPENYVYSAGERMRYYWRLGGCESQRAVGDVLAEWEDRFGRAPAAAQILIASHRVRLLAESAGANSVRAARGGKTVIDFSGDEICRESLMQKSGEEECEWSGETVMLPPCESALARAEQAGDFLRALGEKAAA